MLLSAKLQAFKRIRKKSIGEWSLSRPRCQAAATTAFT